MNPLQGAKTSRKLEAEYGVLVDEDAHPFAVKLVDHYENEKSLKKGASYLVEEACKMVNPIREERESLDWEEYCLDRAFVEVMELRREKTVSCRKDVLPRAEKELAKFRSKWNCFRNKWFPVIEQQIEEARRRPDLLNRLNDELLQLMTTIEESKYTDEDFSELPPLLDSVVNHLVHTVHSEFMEICTVRPREIAKAASKLSGIPETFFYPPFNIRMSLKIEDIKERLSEKLIALDGVIDKIGCSLSKLKSAHAPLGAFLLLGPYGCGRKKLAEALAEEIYGDKERFIVVDVSESQEEDIAKVIIHRLARSKKNGYVVMFKNIDNIRIFTTLILPPIIREGVLGNLEDSVSFCNDIILVSSHVGHDVFGDTVCLQKTIPKLPFLEILRDPRLLHKEISCEISNCKMQQFCTEVNKQFDFTFLKLFNELLVFPVLRLQDHMAISRLQLRDKALSMCDLLDKQVIIYPSDAAVVNMVNTEEIKEIGAHAYEDWYDVHIAPMMNNGYLKNMGGDVMIIYIDQLVGLLKMYSFRVENVKHLQNFLAHWRFKASIANLRSLYRREKLQSCGIIKLNAMCSSICDLLRKKPECYTRHAYEESREALKWIEWLLKMDGDELQLDYFTSEAEISGKLRRSLKQQGRGIQDITEALLTRVQRSEDVQLNAPAPSIMCLGLTPKSKRLLAEILEKYLVMDDGKRLLVQVDLSHCTEAGSFFQCRTYTGMLLTEAVERIRYSVVVFHGIELTHYSVFSTILSILDTGLAIDSEGKGTSFENCVVVIISDLGNRQIMSRLIKEYLVERVEDGSSSEEGEAALAPTSRGSLGLRYELLYRLDQLLIYDPFSDHQLNRFVMLPMKSLKDTDGKLYNTFYDLFNVSDPQKDLDEIIEEIHGVVGEAMEISDPKL